MSAVDSQQDRREALLRGERVEFPSRRGNLLVGDVHRVDSSGGRWLLLCHGMESTRQGNKQRAIVERFLPLGFSVMRFDFSFVGESEGEFEDLTIGGEVDDLRGALDFLDEFRPIDCTLVGSSLGGLVALLGAVEDQRRISRVATMAAVADVRLFTAGLDAGDLASWRREGRRAWNGGSLKSDFLDDLQTIDAPRIFSRLELPVLAMHGAADDVVPVEHARLISRYAGDGVEVEIFEGVKHRFEEEGALEAMLDCLQSWIERSVAVAAKG